MASGIGGSGASSSQRHLAFAPDGQTLVYGMVGTDGRLHLVRQPLDAESPTPIPGALQLSSPLVSPDGRWVVATQGVRNQMLRLPMEGGSPELVVRALLTSDDAAWGPDGSLWVSDQANGQVGRVVGDSLVLVVAKGQHRVQQIFEDGRTALTVRARVGNATGSVLLVDLRDGSETTLLDTPVIEARITRGYLVVATATGNLLATRWTAPGGESSGIPSRSRPTWRSPARGWRSSRWRPTGTWPTSPRSPTRSSSWTARGRAGSRRRSGGTFITRCSRPTAAVSHSTTPPSKAATSGSSAWTRARSPGPASTATARRHLDPGRPLHHLHHAHRRLRRRDPGAAAEATHERRAAGDPASLQEAVLHRRLASRRQCTAHDHDGARRRRRRRLLERGRADRRRDRPQCRQGPDRAPGRQPFRRVVRRRRAGRTDHLLRLGPVGARQGVRAGPRRRPGPGARLPGRGNRTGVESRWARAVLPRDRAGRAVSGCGRHPYPPDTGGDGAEAALPGGRHRGDQPARELRRVA